MVTSLAFSLRGVLALLRNPVALTTWVHILVFDLMVDLVHPPRRLPESATGADPLLR
jgi:hypothetical protein